MSASREKKKRQVLTQQGISPKQLAEKEQARKRKKTTITTVVVSILVVVVIAAGVFLGVIWPNTAPTSTVALKAGDHELTPAEMNYYYMDAINQFYSQYSSYVSYLLDTSTPLDKQYYDEENGITWADQFLDQAAQTAATTYAICDDATAQGVSLSDETKAELDEQIESLEATISSSDSFKDLDDYLRQVYGKGCDAESYRSYLEMQALAQQYSDDYRESLSYDDAALDEAYQANPDKYTNVTYRSFYVSRSYFSQTPEGQEATEEENAEAFAAAGAKAEEMVAACQGDEQAFIDWAYDIAPEASKVTYEDEDSTLSEDYDYDSVSSYGRDWLYDEAREEGDVACFAADENGYYVYYFISTSDNDYTTVNVRQLKVGVTADEDTNDDGTPDEISDEAWTTAQTKAEELLQEWKDGEATEDSFAELASSNSADMNTIAQGGLLENVYRGQLAQELNDWCYDSARQSGDCALLKGEDGYYILYFVGPGENRRDNMIRTDLEETDYTTWYTGYQEKYTYELIDSGTKHMHTNVSLSGV